MLKNLIDAINVSSLNNGLDAYLLIKNLYPEVTKEETIKLFKKPNLKDFDLTIGTNKSKIELLRNELKKHSLSAYILSTNDEFISEYTPLFAKRLYYITGFNGSYGYAIITNNSAALFIDGRYTEQANKQVDTSIFDILPLNYNNIITYCENLLDISNPIAINGKTNSFAFTNFLLNKLKCLNIKLSVLDYDLIDNIWETQPPQPISPITIYPVEYSGESVTSKISKVTTYLIKEHIDALLITALDNIAWLLNIRGNDIECSPFTLSYLIIHKNGNIDLFINKVKILPEIIKYFNENNINYYNYDELYNKLGSLDKLTIGINSNSPYFYYSYLNKKAKIKLLEHNFISNLKSIKNKVESYNSYISHYKDGAALTKLIIWINNSIDSMLDITEYDVINKITYLKSKITNYKENSFPSIVAANSNGAYPHYQTTPESNSKITADTLLLIDCGAQYLEGTTDVTRTLTFKEPSTLFKKHYTIVLKGLIALSSIKFPPNTPCCNLDVLARQFLWNYGLDYAHGTGHGVGHYLSVHEDPIRINQTCNEPLKTGMVLSIEPGYYKVNHYGIRLENLVIVRKYKDNPSFLEFDTLTHIPFDKKSIDTSLLNTEESLWLQNYHNNVINNLTPYLTKEELISLKKLID